MPESMNKSLSAESFEALLDALGLSDEDSTTVTVKPIPSYIPSDMISPPRPITPFSTVDYSIADEARYSLYGQDYLSDFDIWADIEDEDSDGDFGTSFPLM
ncbi:hypothetical protein NLJ89_g6932 [Agrocybe chaxingu]|uniref:Uncharacterized protein n=1 Tax=Agrocybe chaxingu TaxID=84603 RepID=A0A9W8JZZ1_9AGAR|nr:hypothetical protein NLJ89_g6932 [Agrocybe chaxingu]